jgi:uncharacterized Zn-finger protein
MHSGKTYKCSICDKLFTAERAVIQHERIHTGETPYKCDVCGKEFKYHGYLSIHRRIHTGELPFTCKLCSKQFIVASSLQSHLQRFHKIKHKSFLKSIANRNVSMTEDNSLKTTHTKSTTQIVKVKKSVPPARETIQSVKLKKSVPPARETKKGKHVVATVTSKKKIGDCHHKNGSIKPRRKK